MYLQTLRQFRVNYAVLLLLVLYTPAGFSAALSSPAQIDFKSLSKRVELIETSEAYRLGVKELAQKIETVGNDLESYIAANASDADAMVLSVRLRIVEETFVKSRQTNNAQYIHPGEKFLAQHGRLDKAIALRPDDAEAYYWKAYLYGMNAPVIDDQGELTMQSIDLDRAIHFAEQAVLLDKRNERYREALAVYHLTAGDRKSALEVMDTGAMAFNPVNVLLKDIDAFPMPEGTVYSKEDSESYSELHLNQKTISDYPYLRARVYVVPMTAARLEAFFQDTWPEFRFFRQAQSDLYAQYLIFDAAGLRPTLNMDEARDWARQKLGGIILSVTDVRNPSASEREKTPKGHRLPASLGDEFSYVFYLNDRDFQ